MRICLLLLALSGPLLAADGPPSAPAATALPDVTLPPSLDRVLRDYEQAWRAGDAKALAGLFAEDGFILQSNQPPERGRDAIAGAYAGQGGSPLRLRALAYSVEGNVGYIIGAYTYGNNVGDTGKFTLTLKRADDGPWLIFSDMDNSNAPPRSR
ncbi:nuclear transport factor 2 family protein [Stenotrophomonas sp. TD3]|uniref:YybH family protein n=1 Tax=Stenotrophomonas sp. TD3 TaxID=1641707 RepID=UPI000950E15F|nr:nuclear transport factor 2 family protein [Stenotrophomonas sp. TD3]